MFEKLKDIEKRYQEISELLCKPEVISDQERFKSLGKEQSNLHELVAVYGKYQKAKDAFDENLSIINDGSDPELCELAREENDELKEKIDRLEEELKVLLIPKDPDDEKSSIIEIRAGTGGEEASLFVLDIFQMYERYALSKGLEMETLSLSEASAGGLKEVIASVAGKNAYGLFRYESGVHRVQRVPKTETQGRVHTSAITVAVLPEAKESEVHLDMSDIKIDIYRSSGPGGQSVNTTDSAVRMTHIPTGITVSMQDEKSQMKNRAKAMKVLLSRVQKHFNDIEKSKQDADRKDMVGSGDRSERIRTYNFPQGRVTDHRINLTLYSLASTMLGELDELVDSLRRAANAKAMLANAESKSSG